MSKRKPKKQQVVYVVWDTDPKYDEPVHVFKSTERQKAMNYAFERNHNNTTNADFIKGNLSKIFKVRRFTR